METVERLKRKVLERMALKRNEDIANYSDWMLHDAEAAIVEVIAEELEKIYWRIKNLEDICCGTEKYR